MQLMVVVANYVLSVYCLMLAAITVYIMKCDYYLVAGLQDCIEMHKRGMPFVCIHVCSYILYLLYIICAILLILL